jgi:hypothetical protein
MSFGAEPMRGYVMKSRTWSWLGLRRAPAIAVFLAATSLPANSQQGNAIIISGVGAPSSSCASVMLYVNLSNGDLYDCLSGAWNLQTSSDDQTAAEVAFTPTGDLAATDVQAMGAELDDEKVGGAAALTTDGKVAVVSTVDGSLDEIANQTANTFYSGPSTGAAAAPAFRALVDADIPAAVARDSEVSSTYLTINASINAQTGTSYELLSSDNGKVLTFDNASDITLTVPTGLGAGFNCLIVQLGAGQVTPTADGTTIHQQDSSTKTSGQYAVATLVAYAVDTFALAGALE